jgi:hypothetical protein
MDRLKLFFCELGTSPNFPNELAFAIRCTKSTKTLIAQTYA